MNQVCRQVTQKINKGQSSLYPEGLILPSVVEDKIIFEYLLPEHWVVPWNLQQDICLLKDQTIITMPPSTDPSTGVSLASVFHGQWNTVQGQGLIPALETNPVFTVKVLTESHHAFQSVWSSRDAATVYGPDHATIMDKFEERSNWSKVKIVNYMRSVECPIMCTGPTVGKIEVPARAHPDYMEMRELTVADARVGAFTATQDLYQDLLESTLDEIIVNDQDLWSAACRPDAYGLGSLNALIWHPTISGPPAFTFSTRYAKE